PDMEILLGTLRTDAAAGLGQETVHGKQRSADELLGATYLSRSFVGGAVCDLTKKPRTAEVRYYCDPALAVSSQRLSTGLAEVDAELLVLDALQEPSTCNYIAKVRTSHLCKHPAFDQWIARFVPPQRTSSALSSSASTPGSGSGGDPFSSSAVPLFCYPDRVLTQPPDEWSRKLLASLKASLPTVSAHRSSLPQQSVERNTSPPPQLRKIKKQQEQQEQQE
ncbi:MAG: hypothetical protein Q8P67_23685, partial [archaeon]|nr:hypothetical protein [archaeon]